MLVGQATWIDSQVSLSVDRPGQIGWYIGGSRSIIMDR